MNKLPDFTFISSTKPSDQQPQPIPLLSSLIANAFESIGISKKYTGFRYLVDFLRISLASRTSRQSYCKTLDIVAALNGTTRDIVDRDTRHILLSSWKNSPHLRSALLLTDNHPGAKQILNSLIDYIQGVI